MQPLHNPDMKTLLAGYYDEKHPVGKAIQSHPAAKGHICSLKRLSTNCAVVFVVVIVDPRNENNPKLDYTLDKWRKVSYTPQ